MFRSSWQAAPAHGGFARFGSDKHVQLTVSESDGPAVCSPHDRPLLRMDDVPEGGTERTLRGGSAAALLLLASAPDRSPAPNPDGSFSFPSLPLAPPSAPTGAGALLPPGAREWSPADPWRHLAGCPPHGPSLTGARESAEGADSGWGSETGGSRRGGEGSLREAVALTAPLLSANERVEGGEGSEAGGSARSMQAFEERYMPRSRSLGSREMTPVWHNRLTGAHASPVSRPKVRGPAAAAKSPLSPAQSPLPPACAAVILALAGAHLGGVGGVGAVGSGGGGGGRRERLLAVFPA
eukprot:1195773-Prorocentrum_minimum.AAC.1